MSKPLELTVYPLLKRPRYGSQINAYRNQWMRERKVIKAKRFTDAELAAEFHSMDCERRALQQDGYEYRWEMERSWKLYEFAALPHYNEAPE